MTGHRPVNTVNARRAGLTTRPFTCALDVDRWHQLETLAAALDLAPVEVVERLLAASYEAWERGTAL